MWARFFGVVGVVTFDAAVVRSVTCALESNPLRLDFAAKYNTGKIGYFPGGNYICFNLLTCEDKLLFC